MSEKDPIALAESLVDLVRSEADAVNEASTMTETLVSAFHESGLFKLMVPKAFGGFEADVPTISAVCEIISHADGSVGWAFTQNIIVMSYTAYLSPKHGKNLSEMRAAAGMFAPIGTANRQSDGSYQVAGQYQFGSGSGHADYMGGGAIVMENGEMVMKDNGLPEMVAYIVPKDKVNMKGNWDVMGLRGTGSYDFDVPEQMIEEGMAFPLFGAPTVTGGDVFGLGGLTLGTLGSAAWAVGVARRAIDEVVGIAKGGRARMGSVPLAEQQYFQLGLGRHTTAIKAALTLAIQEYSLGVEITAEGEAEAMAKQNSQMKASASYVVEVCKAATAFAWEASGSAGIRNPSVLQRCYRDMCVGAGHQVFDKRNFEDLLKPALGLDRPMF